MLLKPASPCTALSTAPEGRSYANLSHFLSAHPHMTRSDCWLLLLSWGLHRRWGGARGLFTRFLRFLSFPCHCQPVLSVPQQGRSRGDGQDAPPRRTWISRNNGLLMGGSCHELRSGLEPGSAGCRRKEGWKAVMSLLFEMSQQLAD